MKKAILKSAADRRSALNMGVVDVCSLAQVSDKTLRRIERCQPVGKPICERVAKALKLPASSVEVVP